MKTVKVNAKLTAEERETILIYDSVTKTWTMDSMVLKHARKAEKQGWTPICKYVYEDGSLCGMILTAPDKAITIRDPNKKRVMSELQMKNLQGHSDEDEDDEE